MAIAEEAVIADAMKALGQDMQQEAADDLIRRDGHDLLPVVVPIVLPAEANRTVLDVEQAIVGDGDPVRIASDVLQDLLWSGEGWLGVHHPFGPPERSQVAQERTTLPERLQRGEELQLPGVEGLLQIAQEQTPEETGENRDRQEEPRPAGDPSRAVRREPTAGDDAMQVGMQQQSL